MIKSNQPVSAEKTRGIKIGSHKSLRIYLLYVIICLIAYSGIAFLSYSLKWDMLDCYLPWRYCVGESIQNGIFPLWNPYQHLGYPIHADLRSVFYPEALLVGLLGGYSIYTLHFLFISYISLAGFGMYLLAKHFTTQHKARVLAGIAYMLSGYFVSHGQEMFGIIAATWIPYILYYFIRMQKELQWNDFWKLSFFLFLQLSGGYQALSIMLFYLLLVLFIAELSGLMYHRHYQQMKRLVLMNIALTTLMLASMTVLIITFMQVSGYIGRFGGTSLADALFMPFSPRSMISFLIPFVSVKDTAYFATDLSMNNAYTGLLILMLYLLAFFRRKSLLENLFWLFGIICLFAAFGKYTPVRAWLYDYVPLMNLFRMSAFFRYFMMISVILLGAAEFGRLIENQARFIKKLAVMVAIMAIAIGVFILNAKQFIDFESFRLKDFIFNLRHVLEISTRHEHVVVHGLIQLVLLLLLVFGLVLVKLRGRGLANLLMVFTIIEMTIAVKLNFHVTVASDHRPAQIQSNLRKMPEGFPIPDLQTPLKTNRDMKPKLHPLWRNTNIFTKTVSADGFNSFRLDRFEALHRDYPAMFDAGLNNPVVFLTDQFKPIEDYSPENVNPEVIWLQRNAFDSIQPIIGSKHVNDAISIYKFDPNHIICRVTVQEMQALTLMQADYTGWQVLVNDEPVPHFKSNQLFISCLIPAGSHKVEFIYINQPVMAGFILSYIVFGAIILIVVFNYFRKRYGENKSIWIIAVFAIFSVAAILIALFSIKNSDQKRQDAFKIISRTIREMIDEPAKTLLVLNVDQPEMMNNLLVDADISIHFQRFSRKHDLVLFNEYLAQALNKNDFENLVYAFYNLPSDAEAEEIIRHYFPGKSGLVANGKTSVASFSRKGRRERLFTSLNDFEQVYHHWIGDQNKYDSTASYSGTYSWRLDAAQPGSPALVADFKTLNVNGKVRIVATSQALLSPGSDAALYIQIERDGRALWQHTLRCNEIIERNNVWTKIILAAEPDFQPLPTDVLKVFFWINGTETLWVDDFGVNIYPIEN